MSGINVNDYRVVHLDAHRVRVGRTCVWCGHPSEVVMPAAAYERWLAGEHIQRAWPQGTAGERELVISGTHGACWDDMFPEEEE